MPVLAVPVWQTIAQNNPSIASMGLWKASIEEAAATSKSPGTMYTASFYRTKAFCVRGVKGL